MNFIFRFPGIQGGGSSVGGPILAWTPSIGAIEPSDNESEKSGSASPSGGGGSHSPLVANPARSASIPAEHEVTINFVMIQVMNFDIKPTIYD